MACPLALKLRTVQFCNKLLRRRASSLLGSRRSFSLQHKYNINHNISSTFTDSKSSSNKEPQQNRAWEHSRTWWGLEGAAAPQNLLNLMNSIYVNEWLLWTVTTTDRSIDIFKITIDIQKGAAVYCAKNYRKQTKNIDLASSNTSAFTLWRQELA